MNLPDSPRRLPAPSCAVLLLLLLAGCARGSQTTHPPISKPGPSPAAFRFEEVAARAGIDYTWSRRSYPLTITDAIGGGCGFFDYDGDGWMDAVLVGQDHVAIFHNERNGSFRDVSVSVGTAGMKGAWMGCACGDVDGDGFIDLLLTGRGRLALLHNQAGARFLDRTAQAGLNPTNGGHWGLSAGFMDLDHSGRLSLVIANYVTCAPRDRMYCELAPGVRSGCPPTYYHLETPEVWRNMGHGRFANITDTCGVRPLHGQAMCLAFADYHGDGNIGFYIGNDGKPAELIRNLGGMTFRNVGAASGVATNNMGHPIAAMGADWGDYDRDGRPDLAVSAFSDEPYSILRNSGRGSFEYASDATNIMGQTYTALGFGTKWADMDNDGWSDLAFANGHVYDNADAIYPGAAFRQPMMLFHNEAGPRGRQFRDLTATMGQEVSSPLLGRGLAAADFDNDGRIDLLVVDYEGRARLLRNVTSNANHWIMFDLRTSGANRFAYGATVTARSRTSKSVWTGFVSPASSFLSSSDPRIHFGLGGVPSLDTVEIRWPDGHKQILDGVAADRIVRIDEPTRR